MNTLEHKNKKTATTSIQAKTPTHLGHVGGLDHHGAKDHRHGPDSPQRALDNVLEVKRRDVVHVVGVEDRAAVAALHARRARGAAAASCAPLRARGVHVAALGKVNLVCTNER